MDHLTDPYKAHRRNRIMDRLGDHTEAFDKAIDNLNKKLNNIPLDAFSGEAVHAVQVLRSMGARFMDSVMDLILCDAPSTALTALRSEGSTRMRSAFQSHTLLATTLATRWALFAKLILQANKRRVMHHALVSLKKTHTDMLVSVTVSAKWAYLVKLCLMRARHDQRLAGFVRSNFLLREKITAATTTPKAPAVQDRQGKNTRRKPKQANIESQRVNCLECELALEKARAEALQQQLETEMEQCQRLTEMHDQQSKLTAIASWGDANSKTAPIYNKSPTILADELSTIMHYDKKADTAGIFLTPYGAFFFSATPITLTVHCAAYSESVSDTGDRTIRKHAAEKIEITHANCGSALFSNASNAQSLRAEMSTQICKTLKVALQEGVSEFYEKDLAMHISRYSALAFATAVFRACSTFHCADPGRHTYMRNWGDEMLSMHWPLRNSSG